MKKIFAITIILSLPVLAMAQEDCTYTIANDDTLKTALNEFHEVMSELWHGPVEEGKMEPVVAKMDALMSFRDKILAAHLPLEFSFKCAAISKAAAAFSESVDSVAAALKDGDVDKMKQTFSALHDRYRELRTMTVPASVYMEKFHEAMHPLWHEAYEAKDVRPIRAGVAELETYAEGIFKANAGKKGDAEALAKALVDAVAELKKCCAGDDEAAILEALQNMHDAYHVLSGEE